MIKKLSDYLYYHEDNPSIDIYLGDCLEIMPLLEKESVDLVCTDPPWNVGKDYGPYKDNLTQKEYRNLIIKLKNLWYGLSKDNKITIVLGSVMLKIWWDIFKEAKIIIVKLGAIVLTRKNNMHLQWKPVLTTCLSNEFSTDLWEDIRWPGEGYFFNEPRYGHPAMTPLKLMKRLVRFFSKENDIILDPFLGSGTTLVACKELDRRGIGIEISQEYCKIAVNRLKNTMRQFQFEGDKK